MYSINKINKKINEYCLHDTPCPIPTKMQYILKKEYIYIYIYIYISRGYLNFSKTKRLGDDR